MEQLISMAAKEGIWVVLFISFFVYELKTNEKREVKNDLREAKYQGVIESLADKLQIVCEIQDDIKSIKDKIYNKWGDYCD